MLASPNSLSHARTDLTGSPVNRLMSVSLIGWPFKSKRPSGWTKQSRSTQNPRAAALHVRKERFPSHRDGESLKVFLIISHPSGNLLFRNFFSLSWERHQFNYRRFIEPSIFRAISNYTTN